ncbi:ABC transporter substrate-binding protein [Amaricoccus sp. B4]|uniref:ABC transporter substrate-binding protein n=1 Tax=Amaricoccus sp. B4 TaxID=3368557 RepID=UPI00371E65B9
MRLCLLALAMACTMAGATRALEVKAAVLRIDQDALLPISRLDLKPDDMGFAGGVLATEDNQTTGTFLGMDYSLETVAVSPEEAQAALERLLGEGISLVVVMSDDATLLALADAAGDRALLLNATAPGDELRNDECRANVLHIAPSRSMKTDALAQYLMWKKWGDWVLIQGSHPEDFALADAYRRSARKFGARIVEERGFEDTGGARRTDTGYVLVQRQIPVFTQKMKRHDVVVAADEADVFAAHLPYHTWGPDLVVGSAGLRPVTWSPAHEAWGATQFQTRFEKLTRRYAREEDYQVWLALRVIGEAATRTGEADPASIRAYALGQEFTLAAFKGQPVTFRPWNGQLRQPILLSDGRVNVSVSPQDGYLHQVSPLDTLGTDAPETTCTAFTEEADR